MGIIKARLTVMLVSNLACWGQFVFCSFALDRVFQWCWLACLSLLRARVPGIHLSPATICLNSTRGWNRTSSRDGVSISYCEHDTHTLPLCSWMLLSLYPVSPLFGVSRSKMAVTHW